MKYRSLNAFCDPGDNNRVSGSQKALSDLYFIRVRPLAKDFKKAESQAGGGGGQGQQNQVGALSEQERQIIAPTFNVQRDRKAASAQKLRESPVVAGLMQKRLPEAVNHLLTNFSPRAGNHAQ